MASLFTYFSVFGPYLWAILAAGLFFGLDEILQRWFPEMMPHFIEATRPYRRILRGVVLICAVFYAGYAAWLDEHHLRTNEAQLRIKAEQKLVQVEAERDEARRQFAQKFGQDEQTSVKALTSEQTKTISSLVDINGNKLKGLFVAQYLEPDTVMFSESILGAFNRGGLKFEPRLISPDTHSQTGVLVACDDPNNLSDSGKVLLDIFRKANIEISTTHMLSQATKLGATGCILFIGPAKL